MPTFNQLLKFGRKKIQKIKKTPHLDGRPQRSGLVLKLFTMTPKKPNSAIRKVAQIVLKKTGAKFTVYRPGVEQKLIPSVHSEILFRGGRPKDLPGVKYKIIRGKLGAPGTPDRRNGRSKYGARKPYYTGIIENEN